MRLFLYLGSQNFPDPEVKGKVNNSKSVDTHCQIVSRRTIPSYTATSLGRFWPWRFALKKWFSLLVKKLGEGNGNPLQYSCLENPMDRGAWWAAVHGVAKSRARLSDFTFTFHFHALERKMATHSSVLAWRIPGTGEPGGLLSMGSHRVGHDWSDLAAAAVKILILLL